jgi:two-component system invasion response regulator UvrY
MPTVLIADDHAVVRAGYKQFLEAEAGITAIGEASSGDDTLNQLRRKRWNLLLMDIHMPNRSGLDILKHVKTGYPDVRVLVMSGLPEEQYARNVLRAGASGYLSKGGTPEELLKAVRTVLQGRRYVSSALAEAMAMDLEFPQKKQTAALSSDSSGVSTVSQAGRRCRDNENRLGTQSQRQNGQHLSHPNLGEDENDHQRGNDRLRVA